MGTLVTLFTVLALSSMVSCQSCIRNEIRSALQDMANQSLQGLTAPRQGASTVDVQLQKINSTMQQGFHSISEELLEIRQMLSSTSSSRSNSGTGSPCHPAISCKEILEKNASSPSGYYWLQSESEDIIRAYCDMEKTCGGISGGWMKVISINVSNITDSCPSGLRTLTRPKRLCTKIVDQAGCSTARLDVHGVQYSQLCGKIIGYQYNSPQAFEAYHNNRLLTIDDAYVDGISLTHGCNPRKHIWTFAAARSEEISYSYKYHICPCTNTLNHVTIPIPPYVGNDYFCDTASEHRYDFKFHPNDPLWDGQGCGPINTCCSLNNPPWFMKELSASTHDNIEMRLCSDQSSSKIVFETLDLYVR